MSRRAARNSYFPPAQGMSPSLRRARQPFFYRNLITGTLILGFAVSVYTYSIRAVKQEDFSGVDVKMLEEEAKAKRQESKTMQAMVDVETSILGGGGPLGSRKEDKAVVEEVHRAMNLPATPNPASDLYPLAYLNRRFPGRSAGGVGPSVDQPGSIRSNRL